MANSRDNIFKKLITKLKVLIDEFRTGFKHYPAFYISMTILFIIALGWWYSSLSYAMFKLFNIKILGYSVLSFIGLHLGTLPILKLLKYLAIVDNSTVTTLLFPVLIGSIFYYFHNLFLGKLKKIKNYPTGKYYQIINLPDSYEKNYIVDQSQGSKKGIVEKKLLPIHFPLFHSYRVTFLQLGLIGTLFAMTIAFQETSRLRESPQTVSNQPEATIDSTDQVNSQGAIQDSLKNEQKDGTIALSDSTNKSQLSKLADKSNTNTEKDIGKIDEKDAERRQENATDQISASTKGSAVLLSALGTALWSSLMAIFIAFIFGPFLIESIGVAVAKSNYIDKMADYAMPEPIDIGLQFEKLSKKITTSNIGFKQLSTILGISEKEQNENNKSIVDGFYKLNEELVKMNENFTATNSLVDIKDKLNKIDQLNNTITSLEIKINEINEKNRNLTIDHKSVLDEVEKKLGQHFNQISQHIDSRMVEIKNQILEINTTDIKNQIIEQEKKLRDDSHDFIIRENKKILNEIERVKDKQEGNYKKLDDKIDKSIKNNKFENEKSLQKIAEQLKQIEKNSNKEMKDLEKKRIADNSEHNKELNNVRDDYKGKINSLQQDISKLKNQNTQIENNIVANQNAIENASNRQKQLDETQQRLIKEAKDDNLEFNDKIAKLKEYYEGLSNQLDSLNKYRTVHESTFVNYQDRQEQMEVGKRKIEENLQKIHVELKEENSQIKTSLTKNFESELRSNEQKMNEYIDKKITENSEEILADRESSINAVSNKFNIQLAELESDMNQKLENRIKELLKTLKQ